MTKNIIFVFVAILLLSGCAEVIKIDQCVTGEPYGFLFGLIHGIISPFSFVASLFFDDVAIYAINNNGNWYNFGFVLGAGILTSGGHTATKRRKKC